MWVMKTHTEPCLPALSHFYRRQGFVFCRSVYKCGRLFRTSTISHSKCLRGGCAMSGRPWHGLSNQSNQNHSLWHNTVPLSVFHMEETQVRVLKIFSNLTPLVCPVIRGKRPGSRWCWCTWEANSGRSECGFSWADRLTSRAPCNAVVLWPARTSSQTMGIINSCHLNQDISFSKQYFNIISHVWNTYKSIVVERPWDAAGTATVSLPGIPRLQ